MKSDEIKTIYDYNVWAFERVWECVSQISDEQFVENVDYSTGSIRNIVVHMMSAADRWMVRLQGGVLQLHLAFEDFDTLSKTKTKWDELQEKLLEYVASLDQSQLEEVVHWELPKRGLKLDNPRWEVLLHVANHATDHRSQILAILHSHFHVKTVEQDMILYLADQRGETSHG